MGDTNLVPGKWQLTESDNFDNFMGALGVGYLTRKLGNKSKPLVTLRYTIYLYCLFGHFLCCTTAVVAQPKFSQNPNF